MTTYEPGTVAIATVHGVKGVRVMRLNDCWGSFQERRGWADCLISDSRVTDIRPLVVLDLEAADDYAPEVFVSDLRNGLGGVWANAVADQIEAQTKPPRIDEPGLWGVVEATDCGESEPRMPRMYVRDSLNDEDPHWTAIGHGVRVEWDDLLEPTLVREGVTA